MAEKFMGGIGRELRYMEYKLRKKNKGKKGKHHQSGFGDPASSSSLSPGAKDAIPSNQSEEALQLQIALAMSKEEAEQSIKSDQNDKLKLEMAIKESVEEAKKVSQPAANDPWGDAKEKVSFEPFSFNQTPPALDNQQHHATNNITSSVLSPPPKSPSKSFDPWGESSSVNNSQTDAWGVVTETKPDPWAITPQQPNNSIDFFSTPTPNPWSSNSNTDNPFLSTNPTTANQPTFDPLKDFDSLHITPQPSSSVTAVDIMKMGLHQTPMNEPFEPVTVDENENKLASNSFLGDNASLVNFDNLVVKTKPANPYLMTMNTGATLEGNGLSRNPFNQKGPSISMNEMKGNTTKISPQPVTGIYGNIPIQPQMMAPQQPHTGVMMQNPFHGSMTTGGNIVHSNPYGQPSNPSLF